jgi:hypothetical protein
MEMVLINNKTCSRCKKELPLTKEFFHVSKFLSDGFNSHCKNCRKDTYYKRREPVQDIKRLLTERFSDLKTRTKNKRVKYNIALNFDVEYLLELWNKQSGKCAISNIEMTFVLYEGHIKTNASIDRINSNKGYSKDNIQLVCSIINKMKLDMTKEELMFYCKEILRNNEL